MRLCDCSNAILSAPVKISEENGIEMLNAWKVWGSHPEPVKLCRQRLATAVIFLRTSKLCWPGAKPQTRRDGL